MTSRYFGKLLVSVINGNTILKLKHEDAPKRVLYIHASFADVIRNSISGIDELVIRVGVDPNHHRIRLDGRDWRVILDDVTTVFDDANDLRSAENARLFVRQVLDDIGDKEEDELNCSEDEVYDLICAADECRSEIVLCLMGKPGIGKTEAVERFAKDHDRNVVHIIASQIMPNEVSGMTMPNQETHSMDVFDHYRLSHMRDGDILFLDELLKGQQQVLNACLTMIQERRLMSGTKLPDVLVIAAANPLASPKMLPLEIRQRFMFVKVKWNRDKWIDYMVERRGFERTPMLIEVADRVRDRMERDDDWNTLTPRTMTKIMMWIRSLNGSIKPVQDLLFGNFGMSPEDIELVVSASVGHKADDIYRVAIKIKDILDAHQDDDVMRATRMDVDDLLNRMVRGESTDMETLLDDLQRLPEWNEISEELSRTPLDGETKTFDGAF